MKPLPLTAKNILDSDGKRLVLRLEAKDAQRINAAELAARVNALLLELGYTERPEISDGLRDANAAYGAPKSAHKEGKALDFKDPGNVLAKQITKTLLLKHKLRREDTDATPTWCHLDTREPHGSIFRP